MVSVEGKGKSCWSSCATTLHDIWERAYAVGILEHVSVLLSAPDESELDELRYWLRDVWQD